MKKRNKKQKYIDIDDMPAGDALDALVANHIYGNLTNSNWFVQDKGKCTQYFGPRFSSKITDAMDALTHYRKRYGHLLVSYCLLEHLEVSGPYACSVELRLAEPAAITRRAWASTLPLAIARALLKAPKK